MSEVQGILEWSSIWDTTNQFTTVTLPAGHYNLTAMFAAASYLPLEDNAGEYDRTSQGRILPRDRTRPLYREAETPITYFIPVGAIVAVEKIRPVNPYEA